MLACFLIGFSYVYCTLIRIIKFTSLAQYISGFMIAHYGARGRVCTRV